LPSLCLATIDEIHIQAHGLMGGIYEIVVEMCSGAVIYIPSFINTGSGIQKLIGRDTQTHKQHGGRISLL
jgi:hypothetical protein